jgi:RNA polymerase primary sigma factor
MFTSISSVPSAPSSSGSASFDHSVRSDLSNYLGAVNRYALLSANEERELGWKIMNDDCAISRETLIRSNLRLVVFIAKKYLRRGLEMTDLIEEGNVGLVQAATRFDPAHGARFSTYASWWIKAAIRRALVKCTQQVHVPAYMVELTSKWKAAGRTLEHKLGTAPTSSDVAAEMNISTRMVGVVKEAAEVLRSTSSFTQRWAPEHGTHELIADERSPQPHDRMLRSEQLASLEPLLRSLDARDAQMLRLRFGIGGHAPLRLKEIAERYKLTGERVRQLIEQSLSKLQNVLSEDTPVASFRTRYAPARSTERSSRSRPLESDAPVRSRTAFLATRLERRSGSTSQALAMRA